MPCDVKTLVGEVESVVDRWFTSLGSDFIIVGVKLVLFSKSCTWRALLDSKESARYVMNRMADPGNDIERFYCVVSDFCLNVGWHQNMKEIVTTIAPTVSWVSQSGTVESSHRELSATTQNVVNTLMDEPHLVFLYLLQFINPSVLGVPKVGS